MLTVGGARMNLTTVVTTYDQAHTITGLRQRMVKSMCLIVNMAPLACV
jgi:hypothetical protein